MSAPDKNGWMPIASAPRDGTEFIAFSDGRGHGGDSINVIWFDDRAGSHPWGTVGGDHYYVDWPTHWQPLPEPPEAT